MAGAPLPPYPRALRVPRRRRRAVLAVTVCGMSAPRLVRLVSLVAVLPVRVSPPPRPSPRLGSPPWGLPSSPLLSWRGCGVLVFCLVPSPPRGVAPRFVRGTRLARGAAASGSSAMAARGVCGGGLRVGGGAPSSPRGFRAPPGCGCAAGAYRPPSPGVISLVAVGARPWSPAGAGSPPSPASPSPVSPPPLWGALSAGVRCWGWPLSARPLWGFIVARLAVVAVRPSSPPAPVGRGGCGCRWAFRPPAAGAEPAAPFTPRGRGGAGRFPPPAIAAPLRGERCVAALAGGGSRSPAAPPPSFFVGWRVVLAVSARRGFPYGAVAHSFPRAAASFCPLAVVLLRGLMPPAPPSCGGGLSRPALPHSPSWAVFFIVLFAGAVRGSFWRRGALRPDARV